MNEKEARNVLKMGDSANDHDYGKAEGYLEAIEKAKVLVEALKDHLNCCPDDRICEKHFKQINEALAQWEKEK